MTKLHEHTVIFVVFKIFAYREGQIITCKEISCLLQCIHRGCPAYRMNTLEMGKNKCNAI